MYGLPYIHAMKRRTADNRVDLINHIKQHRARLDMTQQDLAERIGVRRQTIIAVEKRQYIPSAKLAFLIARELRMRIDELFELVEE
jgi:putative transcriptional regulator